MAIAADATAGPSIFSALTTMSWNHTVTGNDAFLVVNVWYANSSDHLTGITFDSNAMFQIGKKQAGGAAWWSYCYGYYVGTGAGSAKQITVTLSNNNNLMDGCSVSYTGVLQSGQPDAVNTFTDAASGWSNALTPVTGNAWVAASGFSYQNAAVTTGTSRYVGGLSSAVFVYDTGPVSGSTTLAGTWDNSADMAAVQFALAPVSGGSSGSPWHYYAQMRRQYRREQHQRERLIERARETILRKVA